MSAPEPDFTVPVPQLGEGDPGEDWLVRGIAELAQLTEFEYERRRKDAANELGIRAATLDKVVKQEREAQEASEARELCVDVEPWPQPVDGSELLDSIEREARRYVAMPETAYPTVAVWALHTHAHDTATFSPVLAVTSPTPECGKTTLLSLLQALVARPLPASNITAAAMFRAVEKWRPTMLVDEADTFLKDSDELRGVLNSGHHRSNAYVIRTTGDDHEPAQFRTWAAKAIALIGKLKGALATLASRSIEIELRRKTDDDNIEPLRVDRLDYLTDMQRKAARWAADHDMALRESDPELPASLKGRSADNWRHLFAIGDCAGGEWPRRIRDAAETLSGSKAEDSIGVMLLADIRAILDARGQDRIASADLVTALNELDERPWPEWKGKGLTAPTLARLLQPFKIHSRNLRIGPDQSKGYQRKDFDDAFARYLPGQPVPASQAPHGGCSSDCEGVPTENPGTTHESPEAAPHGRWDGGTPQLPLSGNEWETVEL